MSYAKKLEQKLSALGSSAESLQTLAKWIGFNRKHAAAFGPPLLALMRTKPTMTLSLIHECMQLEQDTAKWDKMLDLRVALGETVVLPMASQLDPDQLLPMVKAWDQSNAFQGPTLINQIRKATKGGAGESSTPEPSPTKPQAAPKSQPEPSATQAEEDITADDNKAVAAAAQSMPVVINYDFESKGIPHEHVEVRRLADPSKILASLQINRDICNEGTLQLSTLFSAIPEDITQLKVDDLDEKTAQDVSRRVGDAVLDLDLEQKLKDIRDFRNIVESQQAARNKLVKLLIQSRCKFGAHETAALFEKADACVPELLKRKQQLVDALELEGIDVEKEDPKDTKMEEYPEMSWYKQGEPDAKRAKTTA